MKISFLLFLLVFGSSIVSAQGLPAGQADCDPEKIKTAPGTWITRADVNTGGLTAAELAAERKLITSISQVFRDNYKPVGVTASHGANYDKISEIDPKHTNRYGHPYNYLLMNFPNYCKGGKVVKNDHSNATLMIGINHGPHIGHYYDSIAVYDRNGEVGSGAHDGFKTLGKDLIVNNRLPDVTDGWYAFGGPNARFTNDYFWWVTPKGSQLPFQYVTRKEFLLKQVAVQKAYIAAAKKHWDNKELQNVYKQAGQWEYYHNQHNKNIASYERTLAAYQKDLTKDEDWLNEWSIVKGYYKDGLSRFIFTELTDKEEFVVPVKPNPAFYNRKLPKSAPQFISIWLRVSDDENYSIKAMKKVIEENIDKFVNMVN